MPRTLRPRVAGVVGVGCRACPSRAHVRRVKHVEACLVGGAAGRGRITAGPGLVVSRLGVVGTAGACLAGGVCLVGGACLVGGPGLVGGAAVRGRIAARACTSRS